MMKVDLETEAVAAWNQLMTITIDESQRQMILLALAHLAVERPGWLYACGETAKTMDHIEADRPKLFDEFHKLRVARVSDSLPEDPTHESVSKALNARWSTADAIRLEQRMELAVKRVAELEAAIRQHRDQRGDDRCWLDDLELYKLVGGGGDNSLPPKEKFLTNCARYYEARCVNAGWPSYQELLAALQWYAAPHRPEDYVSDNGERAAKVIEAVNIKK